ncbi:hypothetical protein ACN4EE_02135 [Geminocystis sp. CENA526]|uniref:hypothetical protein n=1 Tax=Geminocystis sp. CENA526 TaxID=1355871 RepID=UPI003D6FE176
MFLNNKKNLTIIHILTFILGIIFRVTVMGWFLIIFLIPEIIYRICYFIFLQLFINSSNFSSSLNQIFYLISISSYVLMSLFTVDFNDLNNYTMLRIIIDPPAFMSNFYLFLVFLNLTLLISLISIAIIRLWNKWKLKKSRAKNL